MAGVQLSTYGRLWVSTEVAAVGLGIHGLSTAAATSFSVSNV
jgi:hypothetical protein